MWAVVPPMPKPISRISGALRPNGAWKSKASLRYSIMNCGPNSSSARACPVDSRPARVTKLRMRCSVGS
jgi:hypothetical protein